eukprot:6182885-Pyramimonas_sp.AAC.1
MLQRSVFVAFGPGAPPGQHLGAVVAEPPPRTVPANMRRGSDLPQEVFPRGFADPACEQKGAGIAQKQIQDVVLLFCNGPV